MAAPPVTPRILIVDDDEQVRRTLVDCMANQGFSVITAANGIEALEAVSNQPPDLILLDVRMPGKTGLEVLQAVRADYSSADLPVIMLSVEDDTETIVFALQLGANDFVAKPAQLEILTARVLTQLELRRLQQLHLQHIAQLESLDVLKDQFLKIAAHDLRNPLNVIQTGIELLSDPMFASHDPAENAEIVANVRRAIQTMQSIIKDFLDLRALKDGRLRLDTQPVLLQDLVAESVEQFQRYAQEKEVTLSTESQPDLPAVAADPARLTQVLHNLIGNAIKFSPPGARVATRVLRAGDRLRVEVEDNGPGIPDHEVPLLFQEFRQLSNLPTGSERSSGVGLAIARYLVELHGGTIGAESEVGRGSRFWFELPIS